VAERHVIACGGAHYESDALWRYLLDLSGKDRPRITLLPTASADRDDYVLGFYERLAGRAEVSHVGLFRRTIADLRAHLLAQDVIFVSGGNTASMLAVWRAHGVDAILREAWEQGIVLAGTSAGALCWFEDGVTDSYGPELEALNDGLGFLDGTLCPHYDSEPQRQPVYRRLVSSGELAPGYAADDLVALHFAGTELDEIVSGRAGARAFRVDREGEHPLAVRVL
jgi:dipeptidase E